VTPVRSELRVLPDAEAVAHAAVDVLLDVLPRAADGPAVSLVLSGGRTPLRAYESLAARAGGVAWNRVHVFWGDERCVRPDHPDSNYGAADAKLLARVPIARENVHRVRGELPPKEAAAEYEREVAAFFAEQRRTRPEFDLVLLGMGADGHTASLFPGSPELDERVRWVVASVAPVQPPDRVTLTLPALASARRTVVLVAGGEKRDALRRVLDGDLTLPAARVRGDILWLADRAAAGDSGLSG
jgi:6-phosphogluconolactonase